MYLDKPIHLKNAHRARRRRGPSGARGGSIIVVALLMLVNYFIFFRDDGKNPEELAATAALDGAPLMAQSAREPAATPREVDDFGQAVGRTLTGEIKRGQTIVKALLAVGIDSHSSRPVIAAVSEVFDFRKAQVGDTFSAQLNDDGQILYFSYTQSPLDIYEVMRGDDGNYKARKKQVPTRVELASVGCAMKSSLYESIARCGEGAALAGTLIELFAWDVDFFQDVRDGDTFKVIVEKISVDGRFLRYGRVLAAEYQGKFGAHQIVAYRDAEGRDGQYKPDGHSVQREFIRNPLKYTRVSAAAPTEVKTQRVKTASPVVYSARANTAVWAVAGGTVVAAGDTGSTLGRAVTIRHENGFTSTYAHLGAIERGIKPGVMLKQKTVIGKVGATGGGDGPGMLFSLRKDGRLQNPLQLNFSEGEAIPPEERARFDAEVKQLIEDLRVMPVIGVNDRRS